MVLTQKIPRRVCIFVKRPCRKFVHIINSIDRYTRRLLKHAPCPSSPTRPLRSTFVGMATMELTKIGISVPRIHETSVQIPRTTLSASMHPSLGGRSDCYTGFGISWRTWVGFEFDLGCSTILPTCSGTFARFLLAQAELGSGWKTAQIIVNPTQVRQEMPNPVGPRAAAVGGIPVCYVISSYDPTKTLLPPLGPFSCR